jgi:hypothetical protein
LQRGAFGRYLVLIVASLKGLVVDDAIRERMPKRIAERQRKAEWEARRNDES